MDTLDVIYQIQGAADPNHPIDSLAERMAEIFEMASRVMAETGYAPADLEEGNEAPR